MSPPNDVFALLSSKTTAVDPCLSKESAPIPKGLVKWQAVMAGLFLDGHASLHGDPAPRWHLHVLI